MASSAETTIERERLEAAAAWRVRLTEEGRASSPDLEAWLMADPGNRQAWLTTQAMWKGVHGTAAAPEMIAARQAALARARSAVPQGGRSARLRRRALPAAAAGVLLAGGSAWLLLRPTAYETGVGERRTVSLADGSKIALDAGTRVEVRYGRDRRALTLARGQARFDVAPDASRPFTVEAGGQVVLATGTSFNVELVGAQVLVTLLEGRVSVFGPPPALGGTTRPLRLDPGQRLVGQVSGQADTPAKVEPANVEKAVAWETGTLIFDDEPLAIVAERVSRYSDAPLIVLDPEAARHRISGVFVAGDVATFLDTLTSYLPLDAERRADGSIGLRSRA